TGALVSGDPASRLADLDDSVPDIMLTITPSPVQTEANPTFKVSATDPESGIQSVSMTIDGVTRSKTLGVVGGTVQPTWKLSEFFPDAKDRSGWKKVSITAVNNAGMTTTDFKVGTGTALTSVHYELV